jgi:hypothetical protein
MRVSGSGGGNWEDCRDISKGASKLKYATLCENLMLSWGVAEWRQVPPCRALAEGKYGRGALGGIGAAGRCSRAEIVAQLFLDCSFFFVDAVFGPFHSQPEIKYPCCRLSKTSPSVL